MKEKIDNGIFNLNTEEVVKAGLHLGHHISKLNPKMKPFILGTKNSFHLIDPKQTVKNFSQALLFIKKLISEGKTLLLIGTKIPSKDLVKKIAQECNLPYVNERWLGGTFTNFETILKRVEYFNELEKRQAQGEFDKYPKKERMKINKRFQSLKIKFEGIKNLKKLPDAVFLVNMDKDLLAAKEAKKKGIKIIGIVDTNTDPTIVDYPIPASDNSISSLTYILEKVKKIILETKSEKKDNN